MTGSVTINLTLLKSEINEIICFIQSEKERLERDVSRFEASLKTGKYEEQNLERWRATLTERALGLKSLEHFLGDPLILLNGYIIGKAWKSDQLTASQNGCDSKDFMIKLEKGQITDFLIL